VGGGGGDAVQSLADPGQLLVQEPDPLGELAQGKTGHRLHAVVVGVDPEGGAGRQQLGALERPQPRAQVFRGSDQQLVDLVQRLGTGPVEALRMLNAVQRSGNKAQGVHHEPESHNLTLVPKATKMAPRPFSIWSAEHSFRIRPCGAGGARTHDRRIMSQG
jgi:hypothetical protein